MAGTIKSGLTKAAQFAATPDLLIYGMLCVLVSVTVWTAVSTLAEIPASGAQITVAAVVGMVMVARSPSAVLWSADADDFPIQGVSAVAASWALSPLFSAVAAALLAVMLRGTGTHARAAPALVILPAAAFVTVFLAAFFSVQVIPNSADWSQGKAAWIGAVAGAAAAALAAVATVALVCPAVARDAAGTEAGAGEAEGGAVGAGVEGEAKAELTFKYLQVFSACANSFAHGSNDVASAVGPFAAIYAAWRCSCVSTTAVPVWVLAFGGAGAALGVAALGRKALGSAFTGAAARLSSSGSFCAELGAALVVLVSSRYGLPLSSSHCTVAAVAGVGVLEGSRPFNARALLKRTALLLGVVALAGLTAAALTAQGVYSPSHVAVEECITQGAALNSASYAISQTLLAQAGTPPNATMVAQSKTLAEQVEFYAYNPTRILNPILNLNGPISTMQKAIGYVLSDTQNTFY